MENGKSIRQLIWIFTKKKKNELRHFLSLFLLERFRLLPLFLLPISSRVHRFRYFFTSTFAHIPLSSGRYGLPYKSVRFLYCFPPFPLSLHVRSWYSFLLLVTPSFYTLFMYKQRHIQFCKNFVNVFVCTSNFVCSLKALTMTRCRKL